MRIPRIYLPLELTLNQTFELNEHAFQHAVKVLRMKQGAELIVFDGKGNEYLSQLQEVNKKNAFINLHENINNPTESSLSIHLALGISKGDRMDFAIQKAVELGVTEITPLFTEYCVVNLDEKRIKKRLQHWQGIIVSACEQCGRSVIPKLNLTNSLISWSKTLSNTCLVFEPTATSSLKSISIENNHINLIVGPEGGFSSTEVNLLTDNKKVKTVKFGPRILRTETAAVSAITAIQLLWGDLL